MCRIVTETQSVWQMSPCKSFTEDAEKGSGTRWFFMWVGRKEHRHLGIERRPKIGHQITTKDDEAMTIL